MKRSSIAVAAAVLLIGGSGLAAGSPALASSPVASRTHAATHRPEAFPRHHQAIKLDVRCGSWTGELSWGGEGVPGDPGFIDLSGVLHSPCADGHVQLWLHYDTVDNPRNVEVRKIGPKSAVRTPFGTHDDINTYKDIYVWLCSWEGTVHHETHAECGKRKGPGAKK